MNQCCSVLLGLVLLVAVRCPAQERPMEYRFVKGQDIQYARTVRMQTESALLSGGNEDVSFEQLFTLHVDDVASDGTATLSLRLDSINVIGQGRSVDLPRSDVVGEKPERFTLSRVGHLLEWDMPAQNDPVRFVFLGSILQSLANRPAQTGTVQEVGSTWKEEKEVRMIESTVEVNTRAQLNCRYARNEALRGIACMRIEYSGVLMIGSSRVGSITGTIWFDRSSGDVVQERIAREAVVYVPRREGIVQWRIKEEESLEKVHQGG